VVITAELEALLPSLIVATTSLESLELHPENVKIMNIEQNELSKMRFLLLMFVIIMLPFNASMKDQQTLK
jgi:hypothetical protein